jgi:arginase
MTPTFLISSRLGLLHQPFGQTEVNVGVEMGPREVITPEFAQKLHLDPFEFSYSSPENVNADEYYALFAEEAKKCSELIASHLSSTQQTPTSVVIGGDHSVVLAHLVGLLQTVAQPETFGVLMIDSHGDINLRSTSPTGNIHGMWLRPIVDQFDVSELDQLVPRKIMPLNLAYVGNLELDPAEQEFIQKNNVSLFPVASLKENSKKNADQLTEWFTQLTHLHVSIDIDGFDQSIAPATGIPCPDGLFPEYLDPLFERIKKLPQWSVDLVEVNPRKTGAEQTIQVAQKLLTMLLA